MNDESLVYLDAVSKIYQSGGAEVYAAREVTLDVKPGEFFSLLGSSGSGKTTTLRLIGGFEIPDRGTVYLGGADVTTLPSYRRDVHTVFQNYALFPHLTVAENIGYPLKIAGVPRAEIGDRVQAALKMFQIPGLGDRRPSQLSGGQQQRVALARALISRPKVLLLDEPLSALDAKIREEVRQELRELQQATNLTFIYVTHDQEEALALSDRIAVMHNGQVEQVGTPREIYNQPASLFVAQFVGKANFLPGTLVGLEQGRATVEVQGHPIHATPPTHAVAVGASVTVMVRPERVRLNPSEPLENAIAATPLRTTYIGQLLEVALDTPLGGLRLTQLEQRSLALGLESTADSQPCQVGWNAADCQVL